MMLWGNVCVAPTWQPVTLMQWSRVTVILSRCRGFGGSSFLVCASVPLEHSVLFSWNSASILLPVFYNGLPQLCLMILLFIQPTDAVIWEKLHPATVEQAVQETKENSACMNGPHCISCDVWTFWFQFWRGENSLLNRRSTLTAFMLTSYSACVMYQICHVYLLSAVHLQSFIYTDKICYFLKYSDREWNKHIVSL